MNTDLNSLTCRAVRTGINDTGVIDLKSVAVVEISGQLHGAKCDTVQPVTLSGFSDETAFRLYAVGINDPRVFCSECIALRETAARKDLVK